MIKSKFVKREFSKKETAAVQKIKERLYRSGFNPTIWDGYLTDSIYIKVYYSTRKEKSQIDNILRGVTE